ncbi:MAG: SEL1-like repeat protein [Kangiellaceae bacterium]|nr:SEL1-like repeat protein [Kangiellaceae bacterium]
MSVYFIPKDYQEGIYWYEKAAAQGNSAAPFLLVLIYKHGTGVIKDEDRAAIWHEIYLENKKKELMIIKDGLVLF